MTQGGSAKGLAGAGVQSDTQAAHGRLEVIADRRSTKSRRWRWFVWGTDGRWNKAKPRSEKLHSGNLTQGCTLWLQAQRGWGGHPLTAADGGQSGRAGWAISEWLRPDSRTSDMLSGRGTSPVLFAVYRSMSSCYSNAGGSCLSRREPGGARETGGEGTL